MIAIVSMLLLGASGIDPKKMTEAEIEALLKPEKYIAVDTLGDSHYLVKFMKGEKTIKELELKIGFKEYKEIAFTQDSNPKSDRMTRIINKDSIYTNPTLYPSQNLTKIAIRWENLIKREEIQENWYISDMKKYGNYDHRTGLRSVDKIEVYNEDGKKMYEVEGAEAGWDTTKDWKSPDKLIKMDYSDLSNRIYFDYISPYSYVSRLDDEGYLIMTNSIGEGLSLKNYKLISKKGTVTLDVEARAFLKQSDFKVIEGRTYFIATTVEGMQLYISDLNKNLQTITLATPAQAGMSWVEEYYDGKVLVLTEQVNNINETNTKVETREIKILGKNSKIEKEISLDMSKEGLNSCKPYWTGEELILWGRDNADSNIIINKLEETGNLKILEADTGIGRYIHKVLKTESGILFFTSDSLQSDEFVIGTVENGRIKNKGIWNKKTGYSR